MLKVLGRAGIAVKLTSMAATALLGMLVLFVVAYVGFGNQKRSIDDLYNHRFANFKDSAFLVIEGATVHANLYKILAWANAGYDEQQVKTLADEQLHALAKLEQRVTALGQASSLNEAELGAFLEAGRLLKDYRVAASDVLDVASADTSYAAILMATAEDRFVALAKTLNALSALENELGKESYDFASRSFAEGLRNFVVVGVLALLASLSLAVFVARGLLRHIGSARSAFAVIAAGDLTKGIDCEEKDEIGAMLRSAEQMRISLARMIAEVRNGAVELQERSQALLAAASRSGESSASQSSSAMSTAAAIEQLHTSLSVVDDNAREVQAFAGTAGERSQQGGRIISEVVEEMGRMSEQVSQSSSVVLELTVEASNIGGIVDVIQGLAEQTNLLALNAAIEAARAGEQGRGFAVVADEVRKLAELTRRSTEQIAAVAHGIQAHSENASRAMAHVSEQVSQGMKMANEAQEAIEMITTGAAELIGRMDAIAYSLQEQNVAATEIARNVEGVARLSETTANEAEKVTQEAMQMKSLSAKLNATVERFRL